MAHEPFDSVPNVYGGTEYMAKGFQKYILPDAPRFRKYHSIVIPGVSPSLQEMISSNKEIIIWAHNLVYQFDKDKIEVLTNPLFLKKIKYLVVVSEFHKQEAMTTLGLPSDKVIVMYNAITPLTYKPEKFDNPQQIRIVNTSSADRSLPILLDAMQYVTEDVRVEIYNEFNPDYVSNFSADPRIVFFGKTPKATVREAVENAHIHAYPAIFDETFCISQVEAMSAGLICLTSDLGALPEVSGGHTNMYKFPITHEYHVRLFANLLNEQIKRVKEGTWNPSEQIKFANESYSWEAIKKKWLDLHELL